MGKHWQRGSIVQTLLGVCTLNILLSKEKNKNPEDHFFLSLICFFAI